LKRYIAEFHVHTVLSPCAAVEMIPPLIVREALERGVNLIGITDHNASANADAVQRAAESTALTVLPGMELQTREEVHLLCLFDTLDQMHTWQEEIDRRMPSVENNIELFGEQFIVDKTGEFIRRERRLLITAADISLKEAVTRVRALGGLAIPAHVDRKAFSLIANLGLIPTDVPIEALEISKNVTVADARQKIPQLQDFPLLQTGDAHYLKDILGANHLKLAAPTIAEIRQALRSENGRTLQVVPLKISS
jgi:hypothetical protein